MMQFRSSFENARRRKKFLRIAGFVFSVLLVLLLLSTPLLSQVAHTLALPFWRAGDRVGSEANIGLVALLRSSSSLERENELLRRKIGRLEARLVELNALKNEYESLERTLGREPLNSSSVIARLLSKPGSSPYDTIVVDAGEKDGIGVGDIVFAEGGISIGSVSEVYHKSAVISLYSSPGHVLEVVIGESVHATAEGVGGGNYRITLPRGISVRVGESVSSASSGIIGIIEEIENNPSDSFQIIYFRSPVNIQHVEFVTIKTNIPEDGS